MFVLELIAGAALFALASYLFWLIGQNNRISPRWRKFPGLPSIMVLLVLGGWSAGLSFVIHAFATRWAA